MIDHDEIYRMLSQRLKAIQDDIQDLQWRMNQVCNGLSMEEEEAKPEPRKSILECRWCGSHESCAHGQVAIGSRSIDPKNPCARPDDTKDFMDSYINNMFQDENASQKIDEMFACNDDTPKEPEECEHEEDGSSYLTYPEALKCKKCGEFYR